MKAIPRRLSRKINRFLLGAALLVAALSLGLLQVSTVAAQEVNFAELARKIVKTSANVKPGGSAPLLFSSR